MRLRTVCLQLNPEYFPLPLHAEWLGGRLWRLLGPFEYRRRNGEKIEIPKGFETDFASIPKLFWSLVGSPTGEYGAAAVVHDWLCQANLWSRAKTDRIFLEAMRDSEVWVVKRVAMYWAVRAWSFF